MLVKYHIYCSSKPRILVYYIYRLSKMASGQIVQRLNQYVGNEHGCHIWIGGKPNSSGYGRLYFSVDGQKRQLYVHRAQFLLHHYGALDTILPSHLQISHRCHHKLCINVHHLSLEEAAVNMQRMTCYEFKVCSHHGRYADCIL